MMKGSLVVAAVALLASPALCFNMEVARVDGGFVGFSHYVSRALGAWYRCRCKYQVFETRHLLSNLERIASGSKGVCQPLVNSNLLNH